MLSYLNDKINRGCAYLLIVAVSLLWIVIGGCGERKIAPQGTGETGKRGGVLRVALTGELRSLDPARVGDTASGLIAEQIYNGLVEFDNELKICQSLAESWNVTEDSKIWTFNLRRDVRFQDDPSFPGGKGRNLTAGDFKYSFERIANANTLSTGWWLFNGKIKGANEYREENILAEKEKRESRIKEVEGFKVLDDWTFQIELTHPFSPFINLMAMSYTWVVPKEAVEYYGRDFFKHPVGTGPFRLEEWSPGLRVILKKNPDYWERDEDGVPLPYLNEINIRILRDNLVAFMEFDKGNFDFSGIPPEVWSQVMTKDNKLTSKYQKYQLIKSSSLDTGYYGFMMTQSPLGTNKDLRQAFNYAIDRQSIIDNILNGRGIPAKGVLPPEMPGFNKELKGYGYEPARTKELLTKAGFPNGEGLGEITLQLNSGGTTLEDVAEAIQDQLKKVGIKVKLSIVSWPQHLDSVDRGTPQFFRMGWVADYPDPENFLALFYSKNFSPDGPNSTRFSNEEFDRLFEKALHLTDFDERVKLYRKAEEIVVDEAPWLFISHGVGYVLLQPYVRNMAFPPMAINRYKVVWLGK